MRPLLILLAGCATFSTEYSLEPRTQARIAVWVEAPVYDRWGETWASSYPSWIRDLTAHAYADVVLIGRADEVEAAQPDLIFLVRLTQSHSVATFFIDETIEIEAYARDGESIHKDSETISSWNGSGSSADHQDALAEVMGPLLQRLRVAPAIEQHLAAPRPTYALEFQTPPPPPEPPPPEPPLEPEPPPSTPVVEAPARRAIVAVFGFESIGLRLSKAARRRLSEYLTTRVVASGRFEVVPADELRRLLRTAAKDSYRACYDETCQIELGRELAAEKSLATKILRLGDRCITTLNLYDVRKATLEAAASAHGICDETSLIQSLDVALDQL